MRDLDDVFIELASKWDTLDTLQQRYIATQAAGSRQQSRFLAMMEDYEGLTETISYAENAEGAADQQFAKTMDSLESKLNNLSNAWTQFTTGITNSDVIKDAVSLLTTLLNVVNKLLDTLSFGDSELKTIESIIALTSAMSLASGAAGSIASKAGLTTKLPTLSQSFGQTGLGAIINSVSAGLSGYKYSGHDLSKLDIGSIQAGMNLGRISERRGAVLTKILGTEAYSQAQSRNNLYNSIDSNYTKDSFDEFRKFYNDEKGTDYNKREFFDKIASTREGRKAFKEYKNSEKSLDYETGRENDYLESLLFGKTGNGLFGKPKKGDLSKAQSLSNMFFSELEDGNMSNSKSSEVAKRLMKEVGLSSSADFQDEDQKAAFAQGLSKNKEFQEALQADAEDGLKVDDVKAYANSIKDLSEGVDGSKSSFTGLFAAIKAGWQTMDPIGKIQLIISGLALVYKTVKWFIDWLNKSEKALDDYIDGTQEWQQTAADIRSEVTELNSANELVAGDEQEGVKSLGALLGGINQAGGNLSLTNEEYDRYLEICDAIVAINPDIAEGFSSNAEAIAQNASALEDLNEEQEQQIRLNARKQIGSESWDEQIQNAFDSYEAYQNEKKVQENIITTYFDAEKDGEKKLKESANISSFITSYVAAYGAMPSQLEPLLTNKKFLFWDTNKKQLDETLFESGSNSGSLIDLIRLGLGDNYLETNNLEDINRNNLTVGQVSQIVTALDSIEEKTFRENWEENSTFDEYTLTGFNDAWDQIGEWRDNWHALQEGLSNVADGMDIDAADAIDRLETAESGLRDLGYTYMASQSSFYEIEDSELRQAVEDTIYDSDLFSLDNLMTYSNGSEVANADALETNLKTLVNQVIAIYNKLNEIDTSGNAEWAKAMQSMGLSGNTTASTFVSHVNKVVRNSGNYTLGELQNIESGTVSAILGLDASEQVQILQALDPAYTPTKTDTDGNPIVDINEIRNVVGAYMGNSEHQTGENKKSGVMDNARETTAGVQTQVARLFRMAVSGDDEYGDTTYNEGTYQKTLNDLGIGSNALSNWMQTELPINTLEQMLANPEMMDSFLQETTDAASQAYEDAINQGFSEDAAKIKAQEAAQAFSASYGEQIKADTTTATQLISDAVERGLDEEEIETYIDYLQRVCDGEMKINRALAARVAIESMLYDKAKESVETNYDSWVSAYEGKDYNKNEWAQAEAQAKEAMAGLLTVDIDELPENLEITKETLEYMKKAIDGDTAALGKLAKTYTKSKLSQIKKDLGNVGLEINVDKAADEIEEFYNECGDILKDIPIGTSINADDVEGMDQVKEKLQDAIQNSVTEGMSNEAAIAVAQAQADEAGFEGTEWEVKTVSLEEYKTMPGFKVPQYAMLPNGEHVSGDYITDSATSESITSVQVLVPKGGDIHYTGGGGSKTPSSSGGGGGGGEPAKPSQDPFYNYIKSVEDYQKHLDSLQGLADVLTEPLDIFENTKDQEEYYQKLLGANQSYLNHVNSELERLQEQAKEKYSQYIEIGLDGSLRLTEEYWASTGEITEELDEWIEAYDDVLGRQEDLNSEIADLTSELKDLWDGWREGFIDLTNDLADIYQEMDEKELEDREDMYEKMEEADQKYLESVRNNIEEERNARERANSFEDLSKKQSRLALLQRDTSGRYANEIESLQEEIDDAQQELADSNVDTVLDALERQMDEDATRHEELINTMQEQIDKNEENRVYIERAEWAIAQGEEAILEVIKSGTDYNQASNAERESMIEEQATNIAGSMSYLEKLESGITTSSEYLASMLKSDIEKQTEEITWAIGNIPDSVEERIDNGLRPSKDPDSTGTHAFTAKMSVVKDTGGGVTSKSELTVPKIYKTGGLVDYTGPAWVDGTKKKPEAFLNASQTAMFAALAASLERAGMSGLFGSGDSDLGGNCEINIDIGSIGADYDINRAIQQVKQEIVNSSQFRNITMLSRKR